MAYKNFPFKTPSSVFPTRQEVLNYCQEYAADMEDLIKFNCKVVELRKMKVEQKSMWELVYIDLVSSTHYTEYYDAIVLAAGHFDVPLIPDVPGLKEWSQQDPDSISHARYFVDNAEYRGKKTLVVGAASSGLDISIQISQVTTPVYRSYKTSPPSISGLDEGVVDIGEIAKYNFETRSIVLTDGTKISGIDKVLFCTGYLYSYPYMRSYLEGDDALITDGLRTRRLYKQLFYIPDPTLCVVGISRNIIPMPFAETQAAVIARLYAGRLNLPCTQDMNKSEAEWLAQKGDGSAFHSFAFPEDVEYCRELYKWADQATNPEHGSKAENWSEEKVQLRSESFGLKDKRTRQLIERAKETRKKKRN